MGMKINFKEFAVNILISLNFLLIFLLLFESYVEIPLWLQPIGRMHPMLLHFPIVLLLLAMILEFLRFKKEYKFQKFYQSFTSNLLLFGALASGVTAIMGFFLAREEGYTGQVLQWHKWAGSAILFLSSFIYLYRHSTWYKATFAKTGAIVTSVAIITAGHFGASLTHGENFILAPITKVEASYVPLEEAVVFEHVIKPIFEKKCITCHNSGKAKGELVLETSESILKGGKTGKLFVAGKPEQSLLIERIHLPIDEEEHMPPSGKQQLTPEEIAVIQLWIEAEADFNLKVISLPLNDSLRMMASTLLNPAGQTEEQYDFPAANVKLIQQLNTDYRLVSPIAKESPALLVNFYNKNAFSPKSLKDLSSIKIQIVSLDLNKMPIRDEDLKDIGKFENLRKLNLNFTDIMGNGLKELATLKHLKNLSLSGTKINYQDFRHQILAFKNLNTLTVWNTGLKESEIQQLQKENKHIQFIAGFIDDGSNPIKINPPQLKNNSNIFKDSLPLKLEHPIKGVEIRYTTDGSEPDSINSSIFNNKIVLKEHNLIKAKAYKDGWYGSNIETFNIYRSRYKPDSVILLTPLNKVHPANGPKTFFDEELGSFNANSPAWANNWAGYLKNDMELLLEYKEPVTITSVSLNTLIETETIIFPPGSIEIWGGVIPSKMHLITTMVPDQPTKESKPYIKLLESKFKPQNIRYMKIIAKPLKSLPKWHKSKGSPSLLLVDEIFIN